MLKLELKDNEEPIEVADIKLSNFPNPFHRTTTISYSLPENIQAELSIYNLKGQKVKTLSKGEMTAGEQQLTWDATNENNKPVSSGIYMYRLETPTKTISRKLLLMR